MRPRLRVLLAVLVIALAVDAAWAPVGATASSRWKVISPRVDLGIRPGVYRDAHGDLRVVYVVSLKGGGNAIAQSVLAADGSLQSRSTTAIKDWYKLGDTPEL